MGAGFKTFTAGSILTASDVQNYLQDQSVMVFGGTAARSSAIGTANFEEGMLTYLTDVDKLQVYTGASFVDVYPAAATNQGLTLINTTSFSAVTSQSINDVFSATYDNYRIVANILGAGAGGGGFANRLRLRVSGADNTASNYRYAGYGLGDPSADNIFKVQSNGLTTSFILEAASSQSYSYKVIDIFSPFKTENTSINYQGMYVESTPKFLNYNMGGVTSVTTSYTGFTIFTADAGTTIEGRISVYGYNK
jgi:hypothetical protein